MIGEVLSPSPSSSPSLDGVSGANKWQLFSAGFIRCKLVRFSRLLAFMEVAIHPLNKPRKLEKHFRNERVHTPGCKGRFVLVRSLPTIHTSYVLIFSRNALIWSYFKNIWKDHFWGHWGQKWFEVELCDSDLENGTTKYFESSLKSMHFSQRLILGMRCR